MATISVKGFATRIFFDDRGVEVTEHFTTKDGSTAQRKYTAWFEKPVTFGLGAEGVFSGLLSAVIDKWTNPDGSPKLNRDGEPGQSVKVSINGTTFEPVGNNVSNSVAPQGWTAVPNDAPF